MKYFIFLSILSNIAFAEPVVIVNTNNTLERLDKKVAANIFLRKQTKFDDGLEAVPANLEIGNKLRIDFYEHTAQKSPSQLRAYWAKNVFTGNKTPPIEFSTSEQIKAFVAENPNAIAYIDQSEVDETVKQVEIIK